MVEIIVYIARCIIMFLVIWATVRMLGKKSISQMTSYELAALLLISNIAAEPLVYKIPSKQAIGVFTIAICTLAVGVISLHKKFYNIDIKPSIVIVNGKIDKNELKLNKMNVSFLMSLLRLEGYANISEVEFAIIEPNGNLSIIPKSQERPVKAKDLKISTKYEGLALPLIIEGQILKVNLQYAKLDENWLKDEIKKAGVQNIEHVLIAELNTEGKLYVDWNKNKLGNAGEKPQEF